MSDKIVKSRYWSIVAYPESLPNNWQEILRQTGLSIAISPLHDKDIEETTDEVKKAHYHILLCYGGPTTFKCVKRIADALNAPIPQNINSPRGAYRYMTHKDHADKFQYNEADIQFLNGFNPLDYMTLTTSEEDAIYLKIEKYIDQKGIYELWDLVGFLTDDGFSDYLSFVRRHTIYFNSLLKSRFNIWKKERELIKQELAMNEKAELLKDKP